MFAETHEVDGCHRRYHCCRSEWKVLNAIGVHWIVEESRQRNERLSSNQSKEQSDKVSSQGSVRVTSRHIDDTEELRKKDDVDEISAEVPKAVDGLDGQSHDSGHDSDADNCDTHHDDDFFLGGVRTDCQFPDVVSEHWSCGENGRVGGGHDGSRNCSETWKLIRSHNRMKYHTDESNPSGSKILEDQRDHHVSLVRRDRLDLSAVVPRGVISHAPVRVPCNCPDQCRRNGHEDAADACYERKSLGSASGFRREDALEVHLPGDATEDEKQHAVNPEGCLLETSNLSDPVSGVSRNVLCSIMDHGCRDTNPLKVMFLDGTQLV